ncbi:hypothetical protein MTR67_025939 [Solanum verrucosum]|uniref:Uncharacterized protein n=1 Tax=Solanum verrucosum TaxID=315347 RepID=A0AAF0R6R1_SOLVR|nr:hypothetical protein MTR67_025939 [Solanum verrucosum]
MDRNRIGGYNDPEFAILQSYTVSIMPLYLTQASVVSKRPRFDFLSDFIPQKVRAEDALAEIPKAEET